MTELELLKKTLHLNLCAIEVLSAPIITANLYLLDYEGRQTERLRLELQLYEILKDNEFVDFNKMVSATLYKPETETQHEFFRALAKAHAPKNAGVKECSV